MSNDFLSRWSRRKREVAEADRPLEPDAARPAGTSGSCGATATPDDDGALPPSADAPMTPEELAALPDPDDLTATSDVTAFLRKGVPASLRNRAMRRLWSLDPAIRDYVGDARDYAWDWNVPGGVPVSGPLSATTDVAQMVRDIFGREQPAAAETSEPMVTTGDEANADAAPAEAVAAPPEEPASHLAETTSTADREVADRPAESAPDTPEWASQRQPPRHGGALPV
ncbi:DUF3306 domain-containing protein [Aurantimonas marina]|uniref:DUF3306 domain-containing protein n=1 Tax=Aurantimonas marina TaxID=2780508 RepID=UPI0019D188D9|nr:DUF3306 domain-containing protein [Aurantimonas marina]